MCRVEDFRVREVLLGISLLFLEIAGDYEEGE